MNKQNVSWKLVPVQPTEEMLKAMDECSTEGYDERLYAGHAASVYMAAVDAAPASPQQCYCGDITRLGVVHRADSFCDEKPEQKPVAEVVMAVKPPKASPAWIPFKTVYTSLEWLDSMPVGTKLYTTPQQRKPLWIDPNDKTRAQFLPNIGEPILFCHEGKTYYGQHNGGSFQYGYGVTKRYYNTWECRWMHFPAAHGIKE